MKDYQMNNKLKKSNGDQLILVAWLCEFDKLMKHLRDSRECIRNLYHSFSLFLFMQPCFLYC